MNTCWSARLPMSVRRSSNLNTVPSHGHQQVPYVPSHGTVEGIFGDFRCPPHGNPLEVPSTRDGLAVAGQMPVQARPETEQTLRKGFPETEQTLSEGFPEKRDRGNGWRWCDMARLHVKRVSALFRNAKVTPRALLGKRHSSPSDGSSKHASVTRQARVTDALK